MDPAFCDLDLEIARRVIPWLGSRNGCYRQHGINKNPGFLGKSPIGLLFPVKPNRIKYRALQPITIRSADLDPADWQGK